MNPHDAWRQLRNKLACTDAVRAFAETCTLRRVESNTFYLETNQPITRAVANKLVKSINATVGVPVAISIRRLPHGLPFRFYSDHSQEIT